MLPTKQVPEKIVKDYDRTCSHIFRFLFHHCNRHKGLLHWDYIPRLIYTSQGLAI